METRKSFPFQEINYENYHIMRIVTEGWYVKDVIYASMTKTSFFIFRDAREILKFFGGDVKEKGEFSGGEFF